MGNLFKTLRGSGLRALGSDNIGPAFKVAIAGAGELRARRNLEAGLGLRRFTVVVTIVITLLARPSVAHADLVRGLMRMVGGVLEIPRATMVGTFTGPPIVGTALGMLMGVVNGVTMVASGLVETVVSAVPLALKAAPLVPIFI